MKKIQPQFEELNNPIQIKNRLQTSLQKTAIPHDKILENLLKQIEPIDFQEIVFPEKKRLLNENKKTRSSSVQDSLDKLKVNQKHFLVIVIDKLLNIARCKNWGLCVKEEFIYLYNGEFWLCQERKTFETFLGEVASKMGVPHFDAKFFQFREKLLKQFIATATLPPPKKDTDSVLINLKNGSFEISPSGTRLKSFDARDFLTYQLPFELDKSATSPIFQQYLDKVLPDKNCQDILAEYLGYLFIPNGSKRLKEEKVLVLYGTGANGKSVFYEVVTSLLGQVNCSNFSLEELTDTNGNYRSQIANKLVNYASEISTKIQTDIFKKIASGEPISARILYRDAMILTQYAKLIFNCNELPKEVEQTKAYFRRFLIIPFEVTIPEQEQDKELHQKIIENELSGVFNWVLRGLERLLSQGRFTKSEISEKALSDYEIQSDSVKLFLEDKQIKKSPSDEKVIALKELFSQYKTFCSEDGYRSVSMRGFGSRLRNSGFQTTRRGEGVVVFAQLKENSF